MSDWIQDGDFGGPIRTKLNELKILVDSISGGTSGANGTSGSSGTNGTSGANGTSGSSGTNGTSGSSGTNGTNGTSGSSGVNGTSFSNYIQTQYNFRIKITPTNPLNVSGVTLNIAPVKYNKKFVMTYTGDDSLLGIYSYLQRYVNQRRVTTSTSDPTNSGLIAHDGRPALTSEISNRFVGFTDGCGNTIPFRFGSSWISYNNTGTDLHTNGNVYLSTMWWSELQTFIDFFGGIYNHEVGNNSNAYKSMLDNENLIYSNVKLYPSVMVRPNGDDSYIDAAENYDFIKLRTTEGSYKVDYINPNLYNNLDLYKLTLQRYLMEVGGQTTANMESLIDSLYSTSTSTNIPIQNWFQHSILAGSGALDFVGLKSLLNYIHDTYGAGGNDSIWMPALDELYEYLYIKENSTINKKIVGNTVIFDVVVPNDPSFNRYKELSFLVSGVTSTSELTDISGEQYGISKGMNNSKLLINVNYNSNLINLAEKYTSLAELTVSTSNINDANFFISKLNSNLQSSYLIRISAITTGSTTTTTTTIIGTTTTTTTAYLQNKVIVSFGSTSNWNSNGYTTYNGNTINLMQYNSYEGYDNFPVKDTTGVIKGSFVVKPSMLPTGTTVQLFMDSAGLDPILSGNLGPYPDSYLTYYEYPKNSNTIGNKSILRFSGFTAGTYTVNIYSSEQNTFTSGQRATMYYQLGTGTPVNQAAQNANNVSVYTIITGTVGSDGFLDIWCYNTSGIWNEPGFNLIEIIK